MSSCKRELIRKLLALASDPNAAPNEAATAARQAQALMNKHDIDLADLEEAALKEEFDLTTGEAPGSRPGKKNAKEVPTWIRIIAYGVKLYTRTRLRTGTAWVYFSGPREDVELAQWLHSLIVERAYAASKGRSMSEASAFRNGYAVAIQHQFKRMVKEREGAPESGALMLYQGKRDRIMDEFFGPDGMRARSSKVRQSEAGRSAAMAAGIPTGRPITQQHARLK